MTPPLVPVTLADVDAVMAVEVAAYSHPWTRGNFVDSLLAGHLVRQVRDADGACMAYFVAMPGVDEMHLLNLTVAPSAQRRGLGRALLRALCDECRATGVPALTLEVRPSNLGARRLYQHMGFDEVGRRRDYYPVGPVGREDALVMRLNLEGRGDALV